MPRRCVQVLLAAVGFACLPLRAPAQSSRAEQAASTPMRKKVASVRRMHDSLHHTLKRLLDAAVRDSAFPGAIAVIGSQNGPLVTVTAGRIDWRPSPRPGIRTIWDLASLTKVVGMTSAVLRLVEERAIDLDAPVQRYLPEWTGPGKERVTARHLLTHQSGLPAFKQYFKQNASPDSTLRLMMSTPLDTLPGVRMVYSDIGAILLGKIAERVSGTTLDDYLAKNVFGPLGMTDTRYRPPASLRSRIAPTEQDPWRGRHLVGEVHDENAFALGGVSAHAGLFSSARDLDRLARAYLRGGSLEGARLASPASLTQFTTVADSGMSTRALGWDTPGPNSSGGRYLTRPAFGHTGFTGTSLWIAPQHDLYIMLLTNRVNPTREHSRIGPVRVAVADAAMRALKPAVVAIIDARAPSTSPSSLGRP